MRTHIVVVAVVLAVLAAPVSGAQPPPKDSAGWNAEPGRAFTSLTNVVRARHDTAKAAVSNVRA